MASELSVLQICSAGRSIYGAVQSLMTLANAERAAGNRVEFCTFSGKEFGADVRAQQFEVHEVPVRLKLDPMAILRMRKVIREGKFDVVHTHLSTSSVNGCLAARFAKVPCVATVHGLSGKMSFVFADHLIAVSRGVMKHLVDQGVDGKKISVVYNGLSDIEPTTDREAARAWVGLPRKGPVVGTVSRITAAKGIEDSIRAFAQIKQANPDAHYILVGDGDGLETSTKLAASLELSDSVHFVGYKTDIRAYLNAMDLFLFPSHKEAMGIALVEALAAGLPCVATKVGGIPEVIDESVGRLVNPKDIDAMAAQTNLLLGDRPELERLSANAVQRARTKFSTSRMLSETLDVYSRLRAGSIGRR